MRKKLFTREYWTTTYTPDGCFVLMVIAFVLWLLCVPFLVDRIVRAW